MPWFNPIWVQFRGFNPIWVQFRGFNPIWVQIRGFNSVWVQFRGFNTVWVQFRGFNTIWVQFRGFNTMGSVPWVQFRVVQSHVGSIPLGSIPWVQSRWVQCHGYRILYIIKVLTFVVKIQIRAQVELKQDIFYYIKIVYLNPPND